MYKTSVLQLPIYNTPNVDTFIVEDINIANLNIEQQMLLKAEKTTNGVRPTPTYIGQCHFDTTLSKPIWCKIVSPAEWVDSAGITV